MDTSSSWQGPAGSVQNCYVADGWHAATAGRGSGASASDHGASDDDDDDDDDSQEIFVTVKRSTAICLSSDDESSGEESSGEDDLGSDTEDEGGWVEETRPACATDTYEQPTIADPQRPSCHNDDFPGESQGSRGSLRSDQLAARGNALVSISPPSPPPSRDPSRPRRQKTL